MNYVKIVVSLIVFIIVFSEQMKAQEVYIQPGETIQKIESWGHDIKQGGHADRLTTEACRQIFRDSRFDILRIPIYCNAHEEDGSLRKDYHVEMEGTDHTGGETQWQKVTSEGEWFYLLNRKHDKYLKGWHTDQVELADTSNEGTWTQWRLVDAADGWYHLESRGHGKYLRASGIDVHLAETSSTGSWTQWKMADAGNGWFHFESRGHQKYMKGGGSKYDSVIEAIQRAKANGQPALYASVKIYWPEDANTGKNATWGYFLDNDGMLHPDNYAAACDNYFDYIQAQTGETVDYFAPVCEQTVAVPTDRFQQVVEQLQHDPLVVGPEKWGVGGSEQYWDENLAQVVDVKSTHNKDVDWVDEAQYEWNGETKGGGGDEFFNFFKELNQSIYEGRVSNIILWADWHLDNTDDDNNNGAFRRELVAASAYKPVKCNTAGKDAEAAGIAFHTEKENEMKVFYSGTQEVTFSFTREIDTASVPQKATSVSISSFTMPSTGAQNYGSFNIQTKEQESVSASIHNKRSVRLYPNPASDQIKVDCSGISGGKTIRVFNSRGTLLNTISSRRKQVFIDTHQFAPGVYLVKVDDAGQSIVRRMVIR